MRVTTPYEGQPFRGWDEQADIPAPLRLHRCRVLEEWTDYNGHLSESFYLFIAGDDSDAFFRFIGIDEAYRAAGHSLYTVETHLRHVGEAGLGDEVACTLTVLGVAERKVHLAHVLECTGAIVATVEQMLVHVDMAAGRAAAFPDDIRTRLDVIARAHAALERPAWLGRHIAM